MGPFHPTGDDEVEFDAPGPKLEPGQACMTINTRKMHTVLKWCWIGEFEILDNVSNPKEDKIKDVKNQQGNMLLVYESGKTECIKK